MKKTLSLLLALAMVLSSFTAFAGADTVAAEVKTHKGYINGYKDGTFKPLNPVKRQEVATMIARALELEDGKPNFNDVDTIEDWSKGYVGAVQEAGIVKGDTKGNFNPRDEVKRSELAAMLVRAYENIHGEIEVKDISFRDVASDAWYATVVKKAASVGIAEGVGYDKFNPNGNATREQTVVMVNRVLGLDKVEGVEKLETEFKDVDKWSDWAKNAILVASTDFNYKVEDGKVAIVDEEEEEELEVVEISAIDDVEVEFGTPVEELELPEEVEVTLSNEETDVANVEWNTENYDPELEGEQEIEGTLVVPEGKEWTISEDKLAVTVKVIVGEDTRVEIEEAVALNDTTVEVTFTVEAEIAEKDLEDKVITLVEGETELTATFVKGSFKDGKAKFSLDNDKKLEDAVTYTVSADWAKFAKEIFQARVADVYAKTFEAVTTDVVAGEYNAENPAKIYVSAKDQYDEVVDLEKYAGEVEVKATLNGMPLGDAVKYDKGIVTVEHKLNEGDDLVITLISNEEESVISYKVIKGGEEAKSVVSKVELKAEKENIAYGAETKITFIAKDQYNNPMEVKDGEINWFVNDKKQEETSNELTLNKEIYEEQGTFEVSAFYVEDTKKNASVTITVGAAELEELTFGDETSVTTWNNEEIIVGKVTGTEGAVLTPDMIKFEIKAVKTDVDVTEADIDVVAKLRGGDDKNTAKDIIVVAKSSKVGKYTITPYVENGDEPIKATGKTIETKLNPDAVSIDAIEVPMLKVGTPTTVDLVIRNKHGEVIKVADTKINAKVYKDGKLVAEPEEGSEKSLKVTAEEGKLKLEANEPGKYLVEVEVTNTIAKTQVEVEAEKTQLASIELGDTIEIVAGDKTLVYRVITAKDNKGDVILPEVAGDTPAAGQLRATLPEGTTNPTAEVKYYKLDKDGKIETEETKTDDTVGVVLVINPQACNNAEAETVKVTVANDELTNEDVVKATVDVKVNPVRKLDKVNVDTTNVVVTKGSTAEVVIEPIDQYGDFFAIENHATNIKLDDAEGVTHLVNLSAEEKKVEEDVVGYTLTLTGNTLGSQVENIKVGDKEIKLNVTVKAAGDVERVEFTNEDLLHRVDMNTATNYNTITLALVGYDADGNKVNVKASDFVWTKDLPAFISFDAETGELTVDGSKVGETKTATGTVAAYQNGVKVGEFTVNFTSEEPKLVELTVGKDDKVIELAPEGSKTLSDIKLAAEYNFEDVEPAEITGDQLTWTSANPAVTVEKAGETGSETLSIKVDENAEVGTEVVLTGVYKNKVVTITVKVVEAVETP